MNTPDTTERRGAIRVPAALSPARWKRRDRNGRSKRAVDVSHQTLALARNRPAGSAEPGGCVAAALAEWGSTTEQRS